MQRTCTCAFKRALSATSDVLAQRASSPSSRSANISPITPSSSKFRRSFSGVRTLQYPRQATPFSSYRPIPDEVDSLEAADEASTSASSPGAEVTATGSGSAAGPNSNASPSSSPSAWYLSEAPASASTSTSNASTPSKAPKEIPTPPSTLPSYLRPLWDHMYESPFLDQSTINFIDSNAVQENASVESMDASVSSWVDWVVVATLRRGRERGIRGASEGAKMAMKECLKVFDEQLARSEAASNTSTASPTKRKNKIPKVLIEGLEIREPQWCLIDGSKAVVHIMTANARKTWQVEGVASGFAEVRRERARIGSDVAGEEEVEVLDEEEARQDEAYERHPFDMADKQAQKEAEEFRPRMYSARIKAFFSSNTG
ncbi:hypothetical protein P389DRAFT_209014 [Cystobasidium minutum MCA 4210]|uniref:uncharacterized protein n=1 Tax=Cystobasidium minutum MCA 4210 TaxID=1397322 RepID=UPI0034CF24F0|eukprot:jgi/Rhomi1/209014/estExt_Genemark1.C_2_t20300